MIKKLLGGCAVAALVPGALLAQSTGSVEFENKDIVITGSRVAAPISGHLIPDTPKAKAVLTADAIQHQVPGQSINEIINQLPGVSFQSNDPYGSSGGTLTIRGFDSSRISQTFDGLPLNDTGNYALYSNQQLDPELIEQVNVNLGTTDIDSPTAAATGSTVNYRSVNPTEDFHVRIQGSVGEWDMFRVFGKVDTGNFTPFGTRAWLAFSHAENENPFNRNSRTDKWQYNAKIYQPIGTNGDFVSIAGHYNRNRNGNFSSVPLRLDQTIRNSTTGAVTGVRTVGEVSGSNRFPLTKDERFYTPAPCTTDAPQAGVADSPNTCGTNFGASFNPSNTGNVRINSRFTLSDGLVLTVDPSYQYTKANGGTGAVKGNEGFYTRAGLTTPLYGYIGGQPYFGGVDLNGDGDVIDTPGRSATGALTNTGQGVEVYAPSLTKTNRFGLLASLRYEITPDHSVRLNYSFDRGRHRQTGPVGLIQTNGYAVEQFPDVISLRDAAGNVMQKRNRKSIALLNQVSGEYRGQFLNDKLTITAGLRAPFFQRDLTNYCVTETGGSFVDCFNGNPAGQAAFLAANPGYVAPTQRTFKYNKVLPSGGFTYKVAPKISVYGSYTKGLQVPGTDNLYQSLGFTSDTAVPRPETTDNFDAGVRYQSSKIQAMIAGWYTLFQNRLASAYNPELDVTIYRNLGKVKKYGVDGSVAYMPIPQATLYVFGSYLKSKIEDNVQTGTTSAGVPIYAMTAGKRESGAPVYTLGGRAEGRLGPVQLGIQAKRTGRRYINDQNLPVTVNYTNAPSQQVYGAFAKGYTIVDLDARFSLERFGLGDRTWVQINVTNLFDKFYVSGYSGNLSNTSIPFSYIGAPRTVSGTLVVGF